MGQLVWRAQRLFERAGDEALSRAGLTRSQVVLLSLLQQAPGLSGSELARRAHLSVPGVAASLVQMERRGWVRRRPHPVHLRLLEVFLTPEGSRRLARAQKALRSVDGLATRGMSARQRDALKRALAQLVDGLARGAAGR
ncbi:MAG: MarR family transcriptional regulator [Deltaproteobacteria bacterium]|nr:MarR family transcriptional regulator [Deltaproteobacteria bacterium]